MTKLVSFLKRVVCIVIVLYATITFCKQQTILNTYASNKEELDKVLFSDLEIRKKRIKVRKLKRKGLDSKYIKIFINLLEYTQKI